MRTWILTISIVGLFLISFSAGAENYGASSPSSNGALPPVAQPLVREGDFAIRLAAQLDLGTPADETAAVDMLAGTGVAPLNGWLPDYPMTPQIIGQLQESVSRSASEGKLPMTADQAVRGLFYLADQYKLPIPSDPRAPAPDNSAQTATSQQAAPAVINNYYGDYGPPVVTYYAPPPDYFYLYAWVPYPVWWFGFWYPGFYICNNFTTVVVVRPGVTHVVTNHFTDHDTRRGVVVDPNGGRRDRGGDRGERPDSVLRTGTGERFRTFGDMRHGVHVAGPPDNVNARGDRDRGPGAGRFSSESARRGAESIYSRSVTGAGAARSRTDTVTRSRTEIRSLPPGPTISSFNRQRTERSRDVTVPPRIYTDQPILRRDPVPERRSTESLRRYGGNEMPSQAQGAPGGHGGSFSGERSYGRENMGGGSFQGGGRRM